LISREDFIFTVGFEGNTAIVNAHAKRSFGRLSAKGLAEKGLFKAAVASAVYNKSAQELEEVLAVYNANNAKTLDSGDALKRTFGVLDVIDVIERVIYV
jgi:hypothetical protein